METPPEPPDTRPRVVVTGIDVPLEELLKLEFKILLGLLLLGLFFGAIATIIVTILIAATT